MYFDDNVGPHTFNVLNLNSNNPHPLILQQLGSLTPFAIAVDANFIYLSNQHPRCDKLLTVTVPITNVKECRQRQLHIVHNKMILIDTIDEQRAYACTVIQLVVYLEL